MQTSVFLFSRVEIWWFDGHGTRTNLLLMTMIGTLTPSQNQKCRSYPDQSCTGWRIECERCRTNPQNMQHKTATNILQYVECSCLRRWKHLYLWERITQKIYIPSNMQENISQWNRCSTSEKLIAEHSDEIFGLIQLTGVILHRNISLVKKKSWVSRTWRFTYDQILRLFLLISSVFTEQSQICVTNANPAELEHVDLFWWDNMTHCLCPQVCDENNYLFDW